jgi:hypothetical protein
MLATARNISAEGSSRPGLAPANAKSATPLASEYIPRAM